MTHTHMQKHTIFIFFFPDIHHFF